MNLPAIQQTTRELHDLAERAVLLAERAEAPLPTRAAIRLLTEDLRKAVSRLESAARW